MKRLQVVIYLCLFFSLFIKINSQTNNNLANFRFNSDQKKPTENYNSTSSVAVNFAFSNLPMVVMTTPGQKIPDEPKITADSGNKQINFNAEHLPPSVYYYRLHDETFSQTHKWILIRQN